MSSRLLRTGWEWALKEAALPDRNADPSDPKI